MRHHGLSVAVIGGGIGGLSAGLSLLQAGLDVHVYEQSSRISEVGAGIAVSPNATRILYRFGLECELARTGVRPNRLVATTLGRWPHPVAYAAGHRDREAVRTIRCIAATSSPRSHVPSRRGGFTPDTGCCR
jgi:2-polyprenyl-6-methoxyphenol hydroxylase-like FAD-dependent oxidoreductase